METYIFVLKNGDCIIGQSEICRNMPFAWCIIGRTISTLGVTKGKAELCNGPTDHTAVEDLCERIIPHNSVVELLKLTKRGADNWKSYLTNN